MATNQSFQSKVQHLGSLSEDSFRDTVVYPLMRHEGITLYIDTCGPNEQGKDGIFVGKGMFGNPNVVVVQTKKGKLTLTANNRESVANTITQLNTAAQTRVSLPLYKLEQKPDKVVLCASGIISGDARNHIVRELTDTPLTILGGNEVIALIDEHMPEYWHGLHPHRFPYLRALVAKLLSMSDTVLVRSPDGDDASSAPISDTAYVAQRVASFSTKIRKVRGQYESIPQFEEFEDRKLLGYRKNRILLEGEGGCGKTTALRRLAYILAQQGLAFEGGTKPRIPILLRASAVSSDERTMDDCIHDSVTQLIGGQDSGISEEDLQQGRIVLLIDAVDEIQAANQSDHFFSKLIHFCDQHPHCRVICTCRDWYEVTKVFRRNEFAAFTVTPFSLKQASQIVERVARGNKSEIVPSEETTKEVLRRLQEVHGVNLNPMLVTAFAATASIQRRDIPPNITEILKKFTSLMLGQWDDEKGLHQQYEWTFKDFILQDLALRMQEDRVRALPTTEFETLLSRFIGERGQEGKEEVLRGELIRSGLLVFDGESVAFRHPMFQDFFSGRAVKESLLFLQHLDDDWWRNPLMFHFGDHPDQVAKLDEIAENFQPNSPDSQFRGATTVGLALQACYVSRVEERMRIFQWVLSNLGSSILAQLASKSYFPVVGFLGRFLSGKDAVACELCSRLDSDIVAEPEGRYFWRLVALIECGHIDKAEPYIRKFKPSDDRLLLAINLLCFFVVHQRLSTHEERRVAKRVALRLQPRIQHLTKAVFDEFKTFVFELQQGKVTAIEIPVVGPEGSLQLPAPRKEPPSKRRRDELKRKLGAK